LFDLISGFMAPYASVFLVSSAISACAFIGLRAVNSRAYRTRTWMTIAPLAGAFLLATAISPACFSHRLSLETLDPAHILCAASSNAQLRTICTGWVALISVSFSIAGVKGLVSYLFGSTIAKTLYGAEELDVEELGGLHEGFLRMIERAKVATPRLFLIDSSSPQIFSHKGRGESSIFFSVGLFETLSEEEVLASVAHEVAHIKNNDTLVRSAASSLRIASLYNLVGLLLEPVLSRDREFLADFEGAKLSNPRALIAALIKMSQATPKGQGANILSSLSLSPFFPGISKFKLFSRHPSLEERVRRLTEMPL
jgi:heat shock protein HtpX